MVGSNREREPRNKGDEIIMAEADIREILNHMDDSELKILLAEIIKKLTKLDKKVDESLSLSRIQNEFINSR